MARDKKKPSDPPGRKQPNASLSAPCNRLFPMTAKQLRGRQGEKIYRRLCRDQRVATVRESLQRHGISEEVFDHLVEMICHLPARLKRAEVFRQSGLKEFQQLRDRLQKLIKSINRKPHPEDFPVNLGRYVPPRGKSARELKQVHELRPLLGKVVAQIDRRIAQTGTEKHAKAIGEPKSGSTRFRSRTLESLVALQIYRWIDELREPDPKGRSRTQGLNSAAEILASVALNTKIRPGTVARLVAEDHGKSYR